MPFARVYTLIFSRRIQYEKFAIVFPVTWWFIGLFIGIGLTSIYHVATRQQYAREASDADLDYYLWRKAEGSTKSESRSVIIYAWSQYLDNVERLSGRSERYWARTESPFVLLDAHGCLAKVYAQRGDTNLSEEHLALALRFAQVTGKYSSVTNQALLWDYLDHQYGEIGKEP